MTYSVYNLRIDNSFQFPISGTAGWRLSKLDEEGNIGLVGPSFNVATRYPIKVSTVDSALTKTTGVSGTYTIDGSTGNNFMITLSGNTALTHTNLVEGSAYNVIVSNTGAHKITLTTNKFYTSGGTFPTTTSSCVFSGIYEATNSRMWLTNIDKMSNI